MGLAVVGLSHKTAPVEVREKLTVPEQELPSALRALVGLPGISEGILLSTCNRTEVYCQIAETGEALERLTRFLAETRKREPAELEPYLYCHLHKDALLHIFRVASSLDSLVVGEPQILGQVKTALAAAERAGTVGSFMKRVVTRGFSVAKRVRSETGIAANAVSVSYAAVELARNIFSELSGRGVLVIGAGKMGGLTLKHLVRGGVKRVLVTNRTRSRAEAMASEVGGETVDYDRFSERLPEVDIVIASSTAPSYVLDKKTVAGTLKDRKGRALFLIDIAVPRCLDPDVHGLDNVYLYDIDDLQSVVAENLKRRQTHAARAERMALAEVESFVAKLKGLELSPTIVALRAHLEELRRAEIQRHLGSGDGVPSEVRDAVERVTRGLLNKIAHQPIRELRRLHADTNGLAAFEALRRAFLAHGDIEEDDVDRREEEP